MDIDLHRLEVEGNSGDKRTAMARACSTRVLNTEDEIK